ncbi:Oncoid [Papillomaviridae sp. Haddock_c45]|nr:Oncoid [Papillomaviridae sp. Haddock_c45]
MMGLQMMEETMTHLTVTFWDLGHPEISVNSCALPFSPAGMETLVCTLPRRFLLNSSELASVVVDLLLRQTQHGKSCVWDPSWLTPIQIQAISSAHKDLFQMWEDLMRPVLAETYQWDFATTVVLTIYYPRWMAGQVPLRLQTRLKLAMLQRKLEAARRYRIWRWRNSNRASDYLGMGSHGN